MFYLINSISWQVVESMRQDDYESINCGVMEKIRACPICPTCGSKKFDRLKAKDTIVRCTKCGKELNIWLIFAINC